MILDQLDGNAELFKSALERNSGSSGMEHFEERGNGVGTDRANRFLRLRGVAIVILRKPMTESPALVAGFGKVVEKSDDRREQNERAGETQPNRFSAQDVHGAFSMMSSS